MTNTHKNTATQLANQLRENPTQFIQQSIQPEGVFHTTGFKEYTETGMPFILYLEDADRPYVQVDYWEQRKNEITTHQLLTSAYVPQGETECRWAANAHHRDTYPLPKWLNGVSETFMRGLALDIWECYATSYRMQLGTRREAWLFPFGLSETPACKSLILHADNYPK